MNEFKDKNYYEILRVERTATEEEIKAAFKEIALVYHPDSNFFSEIIPDSNLNETDIGLFKQITSAYQTLSNKQKREEYDAKLKKEEISKGIHKTNEWVRPDGRASTSSNRPRATERAPTMTDLQGLQKRYQERSQIKMKSMAEIIEEESSSDKNYNYLAFIIVIFFIIGILAVVLFFI